MRHERLTLPLFILAALGASAVAQERRPFHTARFNDNKIITLAILMSEASMDLQYDFDVEVELMEQDTVGTPIYVDDGHHLVRVRCQAPRAVKVGGVLYKLPTTPQPDNWKEDLWEALCVQPVS